MVAQRFIPVKITPIKGYTTHNFLEESDNDVFIRGKIQKK